MANKNLYTLIIAWSIHIFTALGVICGFQALLSALDKEFNSAILWLALALFIDGVDGSLARKYKVKEVIHDNNQYIEKGCHLLVEPNVYI